MTGVSWWAYAAAFLGAGVLSVSLTPVARWVALRLQILDHPGDYKHQKTPVPYLGGVAIVTAFSLVIVVATWLAPDLSWQEPTLILGLSLALAFIGLVDDLRTLSPWIRLFGQAAAAGGVFAAGIQVSLVDSTVVNLAITVFWIVGVTNAFNLLDNMDGLSAGVTAIAAGSFFLIAAMNGQFLVGSLAAGLAGVAAGFLWHNFHPARIYMGDAGSLFFGFLIAVLGIKLRFDAPTTVTFMVPILVVGVAVLDTTLVTLTRLANGKNPLSGGRDHISHRLTHLGLSVRGSVGAIYAAGMGCGLLAALMSRVERSTAYLMMGAAAAVGVAALVLLARVPVYQTAGNTAQRSETALGGAEAS